MAYFTVEVEEKQLRVAYFTLEVRKKQVWVAYFMFEVDEKQWWVAYFIFEVAKKQVWVAYFTVEVVKKQVWVAYFTLEVTKKSPKAFASGRFGLSNRISLFPIQEYFSALSAFHDIETLLEIVNVETMCDNGREIESRNKHLLHLIPRFPHFAAVNTFKRERFKDNGVPIYGSIIG